MNVKDVAVTATASATVAASGPGRRIPVGVGDLEDLGRLSCGTGGPVEAVARVRDPGEVHHHGEPNEDTDELFLVISGRLTIRLRDRDVVLNPGQLFVVPRGVEHCPVAEQEVQAVLIEPEGTVHTGDAGGPLTARVESI